MKQARSNKQQGKVTQHTQFKAVTFPKKDELPQVGHVHIPGAMRLIIIITVRDNTHVCIIINTFMFTLISAPHFTLINYSSM